jgi:hypothetical protein
MNWIFYL